MKLLKSKIWNWSDVWLLKWSAFLFGIFAGAYFSAIFSQYAWAILVVAIVLAIKPTLAYFRD